ncbi:MAG: hypothetical protein ABIF71_00435 [Planctomycetota bacterium]
MKCPQCGVLFEVPAAAVEGGVNLADGAKPRTNCPNCGKDRTMGITICVHCGFDTVRGRIGDTMAPPVSAPTGVMYSIQEIAYRMRWVIALVVVLAGIFMTHQYFVKKPFKIGEQAPLGTHDELEKAMMGMGLRLNMTQEAVLRYKDKAILRWYVDPTKLSKYEGEAAFVITDSMGVVIGIGGRFVSEEFSTFSTSKTPVNIFLARFWNAVGCGKPNFKNLRDGESVSAVDYNVAQFNDGKIEATWRVDKPPSPPMAMIAIARSSIGGAADVARIAAMRGMQAGTVAPGRTDTPPLQDPTVTETPPAAGGDAPAGPADAPPSLAIPYMENRQVAMQGIAMDVRVFANGGRAAVTTMRGGKTCVAIMEIGSGKIIQEFPAAPGRPQVDLSPDAARIAVPCGDGTVVVWHVVTGTEITRLAGNGVGISGVAFSPDSRRLAVCNSKERVIRIWNIDEARIETTIKHPGMKPSNYPGLPVITRVAFSPDGKSLASGGWGIKLWDPATGAELATIGEPDDRTEELAFSPTGNYIAAGGWKIYLWNTKTGRCKWSGETFDTEKIRGISFSHNGLRLLTTRVVKKVSGRASQVDFWDVATGALVGSIEPTINNKPMLVWNAHYCADLDLLAVAYVDRIGIWTPGGQ